MQIPGLQALDVKGPRSLKETNVSKWDVLIGGTFHSRASISRGVEKTKDGKNNYTG